MTISAQDHENIIHAISEGILQGAERITDLCNTLCRRDQFAMAALRITGAGFDEWLDEEDTKRVVKEAVDLADALIAELDKPKETTNAPING